MGILWWDIQLEWSERVEGKSQVERSEVKCTPRSNREENSTINSLS